MDKAGNTMGRKLKAARIAAGMTVADISSFLIELGFKASSKTIYSWEIGNSQPTPDPFLYMCQRYGITDPLSYFGYKNEADTIDPYEELLVTNYHALNEEGQEKLVDYSDDLIGNVKYKKRNELKMDTKEA